MRVGLCLLVLLLTHIEQAHADEIFRLLVEREAGAGACPDAAALTARVEQALGRQAFDEAAAETLVVRLRGEAGGLAADILRVGEAGTSQQRELRTAGPDCGPLGEALVLALALAVDPSYFDAPLRARVEPSAAPEAETVVANKPPAPTPAADPPRPPPRWRGVELSLAGLLAAGEAPDPGLGLSLHAAWVRPAYALGLELGGRDQGEIRAGSGRIVVRPWRLAALPCLRIGPASACGLAAVILLGTQGHDFMNPRADSSAIVVLGGRFAWDFPLSRRLRLRPYAEGGGQLVRARLRVDGVSVWDSPLGVLAGGIALVVRID